MSKKKASKKSPAKKKKLATREETDRRMKKVLADNKANPSTAKARQSALRKSHLQGEIDAIDG